MHYVSARVHWPIQCSLQRKFPVAKEHQQQHQPKKINVDQVVTYLSHAFSKASQKATKAIGVKNHKGTKMYDYQVEFCHLVNEIQRGPQYIVPKLITEANELIESLSNEVNEGE